MKRPASKAEAGSSIASKIETKRSAKVAYTTTYSRAVTGAYGTGSVKITSHGSMLVELDFNEEEGHIRVEKVGEKTPTLEASVGLGQESDGSSSNEESSTRSSESLEEEEKDDNA